ncbi:MAG: 30S ribosomal protein S16 [Clostridium sp.]|jgi:ribosomal protein S16|nr:30S ribosomal protein S16 [Clostridium sp.]
MVKIRLKRLGYKKNPTYRIVVINDLQKREGKPICELGHYNPKTKEMKLDKATALEWVSKGAKPTETVQYLINNCDDEGKLIYKEKTEKKLSKKALAKLEAEKEAKAQAEAEAAKAAEEAAAAPAEEAPAEEAPAQ